MRAALNAYMIAKTAGNKRAKLNDFLISRIIEKNQPVDTQELLNTFTTFAKLHNSRMKQWRQQ